MKFVKLTFFFLFISTFVNSQQVSPEIVSQIIQEADLNFEDINNIDDEQSTDNEDLSIDLQKSSPEIDPSPVFGINFLRGVPRSISATSDLPVPNDYVISLKDSLRVVLTGNKQKIYTLNVGLDGTIAFPELGLISVAGETFEEVKNKLKNLVQISYVGVELDLSVSSLTAKKISIVGAVKNPGSYIVNPFTTISNALSYSGGLEEYASLRNIKLLRNGKIINYDLYDFLIYANRDDDVNIQQGDTILVESSRNFINIIGQVTRPNIYEYAESETIQEIIEYALGLKETANTEKIILKHYDENNIEIITTEIRHDNVEKLNDYNNPFEIEVFNRNLNVMLDIKVTGPLENEGYFNVNDYSNLTQLIKDLKFTNTVNPFIGVVQTGQNSQLFSLGDESTHDIELNNNTDVIFFSQTENVADRQILTSNSLQLISDYSLGIQYKDETISFPIYGKFQLTDVVDYLGLDLSDAEKDKTTFLSAKTEESFVRDYSDWITNIEKFATISFRFKSYETLSVSVEGEVNLPGRYFINSDTTLADLYEMVGGLKATADQNVAVFKRESVRQQSIKAASRARAQLNEFILINLQEGRSINPEIISLMNSDLQSEDLGRISGNFSINSPIAENFFLAGGDSVFIPKRLSSVAIVGEVLNPTTILFKDNLKLKDYVRNAGGYKQFALKNSIYVIKADGTIENPSGFLVFKSYPKIEPGDTIVIPRDINIKDDELRDLLVPITSILSNLAFASAALNQLDNN